MQGFEAAKRALEMDDSISAVHKVADEMLPTNPYNQRRLPSTQWMAIMYSDMTDFTGSKEKLLQSYKMKVWVWVLVRNPHRDCLPPGPL